MNSKDLNYNYEREKLKAKIRVANSALRVASVKLLNICHNNPDIPKDVLDKIDEERERLRDLEDFLKE